MNTIPCSCGGENQNCFKCDGTGMVASCAQQFGRPHLAPGARAPEKKPAYRPVKGSFKKPSKNIKGPIKPPEYKNGPSPVPPRVITIQLPLVRCALVLVTCPHCGASVKALKKHYEKAHSAAAVSHKLAVKQKPRAKRKVLKVQDKQLNVRSGTIRVWHSVDPPTQQVDVRTTQLHKYEAPPKGGNCTPSSSKGRIYALPSRGVSTSEQAGLGGSDATHGWGGSFRDNGQFGSYPSHDDMGEESET